MSAGAAMMNAAEDNLTPLQRSEAELNRAIEGLRASPPAMPAHGAETSAYGPGSALMNIPVEVQVVIGAREMTVAELMGLSDGETVALNRRVGEPADVIVNGVRIAKGEITVMKDDPTRFGFKISEILK
jgi:flagellar motor switch protein FliN/FliY